MTAVPPPPPPPPAMPPVVTPLGARKRAHAQIDSDGRPAAESEERKRVAMGSGSESESGLEAEATGRGIGRRGVGGERDGDEHEDGSDSGDEDDGEDEDQTDDDDDDDDDDDEDTKAEQGEESPSSSMEDILENAELHPYTPFLAEEKGFGADDSDQLRSRLLEIGPEVFLRETLKHAAIDPRMLGTAFGLDPLLCHSDDEKYLRILGLAVVRAFYKRRKLQQYNTIEDASRLLSASKNIMVVTGAGISTSLGIPDFRSKVGGFYTSLLKEGYDDPEAVFHIENFDQNPGLFYRLAGNILPDLKRFSPTHAFLKLLQDQGKLMTNYTQNIDNLEAAAGIEKNRLIQCHGSFGSATCRKCKYKVNGEAIFDDIRRKQVPYCPRCEEEVQKARARQRKRKQQRHRDDSDDSDDDDVEAGVLKPDITFFGEQLPSTFFDRFLHEDVDKVDLVVVIGTSLKVAPVSDMPDHLPNHIPHIYISREPVEHISFDIQLLGNCDDIVFELCRRAGWQLNHEMIPQGFSVEVSPLGESSYRWSVTPGGLKSQPPPLPIGLQHRISKPSSRSASPAKLSKQSSRTSSPAKKSTVPPSGALSPTVARSSPQALTNHDPQPHLSSPARSTTGTATIPDSPSRGRLLASRPMPGSPSHFVPAPNRPTLGARSRSSTPNSVTERLGVPARAGFDRSGSPLSAPSKQSANPVGKSMAIAGTKPADTLSKEDGSVAKK